MPTRKNLDWLSGAGGCVYNDEHVGLFDRRKYLLAENPLVGKLNWKRQDAKTQELP